MFCCNPTGRGDHSLGGFGREAAGLGQARATGWTHSRGAEGAPPPPWTRATRPKQLVSAQKRQAFPYPLRAGSRGVARRPLSLLVSRSFAHRRRHRQPAPTVQPDLPSRISEQ
jgi:hypothetical protein